MSRGVDSFSKLEKKLDHMSSAIDKLTCDVSVSKATVPCRFFGKGQCNRDPCPFLHDSSAKVPNVANLGLGKGVDKHIGKGKGKAKPPSCILCNSIPCTCYAKQQNPLTQNLFSCKRNERLSSYLARHCHRVSRSCLGQEG